MHISAIRAEAGGDGTAPPRRRGLLPSFSLRTRLLLVILTCLLPTAAIQLFTSWRDWQDRKEQVGAIVTQQAQLLAGDIESLGAGARILLGAAAEFRQLRVRGEGCNARLAGLREQAPGYAFLALLDPAGRVACASDPVTAEAADGLAWRRAALAADRFSAGVFTRSEARPAGFVPFFLPLDGTADREAGVLVAALDLDWLAAHLQGLKRAGLPFLARGILTIADREGTILARDARHADFVGHRFPDAALGLLHATEPGTLRLRSIDGTDRLVGFVPPLPERYGLAAVIGVDETELMGDLRQVLTRTAATLALGMLIAALLTALVAHRFITRPTQSLLRAARRWREGDLSARAPCCGHRSEFGQLALACNTMAASLQRRDEELRGYNRALEEAVTTRTRALTQANAQLKAEIAERRTTETALLQAQKLQAVGQLAGGVAHDFNNVLQAVLGGIVLVRRRAGDPAAVERLARMIEESARRGESITRRLLAFSRREELRAEVLDIGGLFRGLHEVLRATLGARIEVKVEAAPDLPAILADRGQLETVLVNLATNARDAMPQGGTLTFEACVERLPASRAEHGLAPGSYVRLSVGDTGEGMSAETLARATEPFFTTKSLGKGTGLGLAMARGFAQGSGGGLAIRSAPGLGTTVSLWLPMVVEPAQDAAPDERLRARAVRATPAMRVLLVDDEPAVREVLEAGLAESGFVVTPAADGAEALDRLAGGLRVDALVSDLAMPGMDGVALIREAQRRQPGLPAILLTGFAGDAASLAVGAAVSGHFVLVRKPVSAGDLADRVACLIADRAEVAAG
jgi:signal transduction histidine kinase/CheY-like chemotaxis protein